MIDAIPDPIGSERGQPRYLDEHDHLPMVRAHAGITFEDDPACLAILTGLGCHRPADNDPAFWSGSPNGGRAA